MSDITENEDGTFIIDLKITMEWKGESLPDDDTIIAPIKRFVKKTIKAYEKKVRLVNVKTNIYEIEYEEEAFEEN